MLIEIREEIFCIRHRVALINVGMVDVAEGEEGGKNQAAGMLKYFRAV